MILHPSLIHVVEQLSATVRDTCDLLDVNLSDPSIRRAVHAVCLTFLEAKPSIESQVLVDAWQEAIK